MNTLTIVWKYLTGGAVGVADYALQVLQRCIDDLDTTTKAKIENALNISKKVLNTLRAFQWLIPTKWQIAYDKTIECVYAVIGAFDDQQITLDEVVRLKGFIAETIAEWNKED